MAEADNKAEEAKAEEPKSVFDTVNAAVKDKVAAGQAGLRDRVIETLTKAELDKRADLLLGGLKKVGEMRTEAKKLRKPTNVVEKFIEGKFVKEESFTSEAVKKIKENDEKLAKLEAALAKAIDKADYDALKKAVGNASNAGGGESKEDALE